MRVIVLNTGMLRHVAQLAETHDFNRQIDVTGVDPQGMHLVKPVLMFHQAVMPKPVDAPEWPPHHRCMVYMKMRGTDVPTIVVLDIPASVYDELPVIEMEGADK